MTEVLIATIDAVSNADDTGTLRAAEASAYRPGVATDDLVHLVLHGPPGLHLPGRAGDRVLLVVPSGGSAAGAFPIASAGVEVAPQHGDNTEVRSLAGCNVVVAASPGGVVRLGADPDGASTEYGTLMLYAKASAELLNLQAQLEQVVAAIETSLATKPGVPGGLISAALDATKATYPAGVTGGEAASGLVASRAGL